MDNSNNEEQFEMNYTARLEITANNPSDITALYEAILPETTVVISSRGKTIIEMKSDTCLELVFLAADFVSLRAMINSYIRWLDAGYNSIYYLKVTDTGR
ncbi:MAG: hypothetical protein FK734_07385 [Asgard group archaeon]|nr:hypothetical protein [Asgard group archaeon]